MIRVRRVFLRPEKTDEFIALVKTELMPFVKQSGVGTFAYSRVRFGGASNEFSSVTGINSWADLDEMPSYIKAMGDAKYKAYVAKTSSMITRAEVNVYRYQADLSYMPPTLTASK